MAIVELLQYFQFWAKTDNERKKLFIYFATIPGSTQGSSVGSEKTQKVRNKFKKSLSLSNYQTSRSFPNFSFEYELRSMLETEPQPKVRSSRLDSELRRRLSFEDEDFEMIPYHIERTLLPGKGIFCDEIMSYFCMGCSAFIVLEKLLSSHIFPQVGELNPLVDDSGS